MGRPTNDGRDQGKDAAEHGRSRMSRRGMLGAAIAGGAALPQRSASAADTQLSPPETPPWTTSPGAPIGSPPYGAPSPFEAGVVRRARRKVAFGGAASSGTPLQKLFGIVTPNGLHGLGRVAHPNEIAGWDTDVSPTGKGLPPGRGDVAEGEAVFAQRCSACHGAKGEGGLADRLVGGQGSLVTPSPVKTVGSYWPFATTAFDYIRRAMPYNAPQSLAPREVYGLVAYVLWLNGIVPRQTVLDEALLPRIRMPNREGFTRKGSP